MTETVKLKSPIDGSIHIERPVATEAGIEAAVSRARAAQAEWAGVSVAERGKYLLAFLEALLAMNDEIVPELAWQMGRPVRYGGEKGGVEERTRYMVALAEKALAPYAPEDRPGFRRYLKRAPLGVVFTIAPWNYPYLTTVNSVVPALMAGNAVILKHAAQTLLVGERFQAAFDRAGLPRGLFQNLVLSHGQTERLLGSGKIDHCNFTGSVAGGRAIEKAAAGTFMTLGLELGGKDPAYVLPDAKLDHAIANLVDGAFYNSGQCCCGIERIYVNEKLYDAFVDYRESLGFEVLAHAGGTPPYPRLREVLQEGGIVALLGERDLRRRGVEVDFFGERTTMPAGAARLALDTGAALHVAHCWFTGDGWGMSVSEEIEVDTPENSVQRVADRFAANIAEHPADWHMLQPLWPADAKKRGGV